MLQQIYKLPSLPPNADFQTAKIVRVLINASRALAKFDGEAQTIPNKDILISTLSLQEALVSSEIENIVTTEDELFQADIFPDSSSSPATKEVKRYHETLRYGYDKMLKNESIISNNLLIELFQQLKQQQTGFRNTPGTVLRNEQTGEDVYVPPQDHDQIVRLMTELEQFINNDEICDLDPLIKMALIHHQFESIHPFSDGNGRIGRILNILYLTRTRLLSTPILYMSRCITRTKSDYYLFLQNVRDNNDWESWVVYMLYTVSIAAYEGLNLVTKIRILMMQIKNQMRNHLPQIYSQDLLNSLFLHPYTRIEHIQSHLGVSRQTASKYLKSLAQHGILSEFKSGRNLYYVNATLVKILQDDPQ